MYKNGYYRLWLITILLLICKPTIVHCKLMTEVMEETNAFVESSYIRPSLYKFMMVVDGIEDKLYDDIGRPVFSYDSKHVAYKAKNGKVWCIVLDGKEGEKMYEEILDLQFSPDSKQVALITKENHKCSVVVDGEEWKK